MGRSKKQTDDGAARGTETVRVEADIASKLTIISIRRKQSVSALLSPHLRPWVEKLYREVVQEMHDEATTKPPKEDPP